MSENYIDNFNLAFQTKILSLMVRDKDFIVSHYDTIKAKYFTAKPYQLLAQIILSYHSKYKKIPTYEVLEKELEKNIIRNPGLDITECFDLNREIFTINLEDSYYIKDEVILFAKKQALKEAFQFGIEEWHKKEDIDYDLIKKHIEDALRVGVDKNDLGDFYIKDYKKRLEERIALIDNEIRIPITFSRSLNMICNGGLCAEDLVVVLGVTGKGKTHTLINFANSFIESGKRGIYYSLEMRKEQMWDRLDARGTKTPINSVLEHLDMVSDRMESFLKNSPGTDLLIKKYPERGASVNTLISHLSLLEGYYGFKPEFIITDYADIMKPIKSYKDKIDSQAEIYSDLKFLAQTYKTPVITACQSNRVGWTKDTIDLSEISDAYAKTFGASIILTINSTKEEMAHNKCRIYVAKNRDGRQGDEVQLTFDRSRGFMYEMDDDLEQNSLLFV